MELGHYSNSHESKTGTSNDNGSSSGSSNGPATTIATAPAPAPAPATFVMGINTDNTNKDVARMGHSQSNTSVSNRNRLYLKKTNSLDGKEYKNGRKHVKTVYYSKKDNIKCGFLDESRK